MSSLAASLGLLKRAVRYRNLDTARLIQRNLSYLPTALAPAGNKIAVPEFGLLVDPTSEEWILKSLVPIRKLVHACGARFESSTPGKLVFRLGEIAITIESEDEAQILVEVFGDHTYHLEFGRPAFAIDIGANIGTSAVYMAAVLGHEVVGYELFPATAALAVANVAASGLADRVSIQPFGVGGRAEKLDLPYDRDLKGLNGMYGNWLNLPERTPPTVQVEILDVAQVMTEAVARAAGRPILAKIDCEGAEFDVFDRLVETDQLKHLDALAIEVHRIPGHDPASLTRLLLDQGYTVHTAVHPYRPAGMIHAVRAATP